MSLNSKRFIKLFLLERWQIYPLDLTQFIESSNRYNYQFLEAQVPGNPNGLLPLFNRICNVPYFGQPDGPYFGCWDKKSRDKIKTLYPSSRILETEDFEKSL